MADVDTSLYPKPQNPLDTLSGFARLQAIQNQNRLFQQQFQTNLGTARAYKEAMNPDGTVNYPALFNLAKQDPNVALGMGQIISEGQKNQEQVYRNQIAQLDTARQKLDAVSGYLSPIAALGSKASSSDVVAALAHAGTVGIASPEEQARIYSTLPRLANGQINESGIQDWVKAQQLAVQDKQTRLLSMYPAPQFQATPGGGMAPYSMSPITGVQQVGPSVAPAAGPTTTEVGPGGEQRFVGAPPANPYELEYQRRIQAMAPGNAGAPPASPGAPAAPPAAPASNVAGHQAGLSPAASTAMTGQGQASIQMASALQGRADQVPNNKGLLSNLNASLEGFTPGPGAKWNKEALAAGNRLAQMAGFKGFSGDSVKAQEEFDKMATQLAQSQFTQLGGTGANFQLESTISTSPNSALSKLGNKGIISLLQGNEDAIAAKNRAWQKYQQQNGPQSYGAFSTEFNQHFDPRVFQFQYLNKDEQKKLISGMTPTQKNKLHADAIWAKQQGLIGGQ